MKSEQVIEEFSDYYISVFDKLDPEVKARILDKINNAHKDGRNKSSKEELKEFYSVKEAAQKMHVSGQTIRNWIKEEKITCTRIGRTIRISKDDIMKACLSIDSNIVICLMDMVYFDKATNEEIVFEKDKLYKIIDENKTQVTLFSFVWQQAANFSKHSFNKFFTNAEECHYDQIKYNINELS